MISVSSRIWTRIAVFISYGDNDYTTGTTRLFGGAQNKLYNDSFDCSGCLVEATWRGCRAGLAFT